MNDQELITRVRQSFDKVHMSVPEELITSRSRAVQAARRRRVAVGVAAIATSGAAAVTAALIIPGPAAPATEDTAYVVSQVTQALTAVPANAILFTQMTITGPDSATDAVMDMWRGGDGQGRTEIFVSGQIVSEYGVAVTGTAVTRVSISYRDKTWSRAVSHSSTPSVPSASASAQDTIACGSADDAIGISVNAKAIADQLRSRESCGLLKADGTATVGGVTAIRLTEPTNDGVTASWYVNSATYLPIRRTVTQRGVLLSTDAFQWLPRTAANLARLSLPVAPRGFAQVANAASTTASLVLGAFAHRPLPGRG